MSHISLVANVFFAEECEVFCVGKGEFGQLGAGKNQLESAFPLRNPFFKDLKIVSLTTGMDHCVALRRNFQIE